MTSDGRDADDRDRARSAALTLEQPLQPLDGAGVALGASLERLVDAVELRSEPETTVVLVKSLPGADG